MRQKTLLIISAILISYFSFSQEVDNNNIKKYLNSSLSNIYKETLLRPGRVSVDSIVVNDRKKSIEFHTNLSLSYLPMRENTVRQIYDTVRYYLPVAQKKYRIGVFSDKQ